MEVTVFVRWIFKDGNRALVQASNGSPDGPPLVRFEITDPEEAARVRPDDRYKVTIERAV